MKNSEIKKNILSKSPDIRYKTAKYLAANPSHDFKKSLQTAFDKENVGYIKNTFKIAISRIDKTAPQNSQSTEIENTIYNELNIHQKGMDDMAGIFLHEIEPIIGRIALTAYEEIKNFENSETFTHIEKLKLSLKAINEFRQANKSKTSTEINLEKLISTIINSEHQEKLKIPCENH